MTTSIDDLLSAIHVELSQPGAPTVGDAAATLLQIGHVLRALCRDGLDAECGGEREMAASGLATRCTLVGDTWAAVPGRGAALVGALGDALGRLHEELTQSDRWAVAIRVSPVAMRCAQAIETSGPFDHIADLASISTAVSKVRRCAAAAPPDPLRCMSLKRPMPEPWSAAARPAEEVHHAMASILDELSRRGREPIGIRQALSISRTAELLCRTLNDPAIDGGSPAEAAAWRDARMQLSRFEDGRRFDPADQLIRMATTAAQNLEAILTSGHPSLSTDDVSELRQAGATLSPIAARIGRQIRLRNDSLIVPIGPRPLREARVSEWLQKKAFVADRQDLARVRRSWSSAERVSFERSLAERASLEP